MNQHPPTNIGQPRWLPEEDAMAITLYQQGAFARDIVSTINSVFHNGRSKAGVHHRMCALNIRHKWRRINATDDRPASARRLRAEPQPREDTVERPQPWHPARDAKPLWLRRQALRGHNR